MSSCTNPNENCCTHHTGISVIRHLDPIFGLRLRLTVLFTTTLYGPNSLEGVMDFVPA